RTLELAGACRENLQVVALERRRFARFRVAQPVVMEVQAFHGNPERSECVEIALTRPPPIDELDTELEGRVRGPNEVVFVQIEQSVEVQNVRDGRLADPDGPD